MHVISIDTRLGVATTLGSEVAAMCVQLVDASGNLAIHMPTRILLRSSSTHEPSDPPLEVVRYQASASPDSPPFDCVHKVHGPSENASARSKNVGGFWVFLAFVFLWHATRQPVVHALPRLTLPSKSSSLLRQAKPAHGSAPATSHSPHSIRPHKRQPANHTKSYRASRSQPGNPPRAPR